MASDEPNVSDLLTTVKEYLTQLKPKLNAEDRYFALCCVYLLEIVEREIGADPRSVASSKGLFDELLDGASEMTAREKIENICEDIRAGDFDDDLERLHQKVFDHVVSKVKISDPTILEN